MNTENREAVNSLEGLLEEIERAYSKRSHAPKQTHDPPWALLEAELQPLENDDTTLWFIDHGGVNALAAAHALHRRFAMYAVEALAVLDAACASLDPQAINALERLLKAVKIDYSKRAQAPKQACDLPWDLLEFFTRQFEWGCHVRARYHMRKGNLAGARAPYLQLILFAVTVLATTDCERAALQKRQALCGQQQPTV